MIKITGKGPEEDKIGEIMLGDLRMIDRGQDFRIIDQDQDLRMTDQNQEARIRVNI